MDYEGSTIHRFLLEWHRRFGNGGVEPKSHCTNCGVHLFPQPEPHRIEKNHPCPGCGRKNLIADRYCGGCGERLLAPSKEPVITQG